MRGLLTGKISGVEQYTLQTLKSLLATDKENTYVLFYVAYKDNDSKFAELVREYPFLSGTNVEVKKMQWPDAPLLLHIAFKFFNLPKIDDVCGGLDVMWMPSPELLPLSRRCKRVVTFHDLIFLLYPETYTFYSRLWQWQMNYPGQARIADHIIAVSEATKRDLVNLTHTNPQKITVIHEGVGPEYFATPEPAVFSELVAKFHLPPKYLYYVGSIEPRKNLSTVVRALSRMNSGMSGTIKLVISGSKSWKSEGLYKLIEEMGLQERVIFTGRVTDTQKIALMAGSLAFTFPSIYEGFGLMVLEAMAAGTPVITSNVSSLPEVAGDASILIDPNDDVALAAAVTKLLQDDSYRSSLIEMGRNRAHQFSWDKSAQATLAILKEVAK